MKLEQCLQAGFVPILHFVQKVRWKLQPAALCPVALGWVWRPSALWGASVLILSPGSGPAAACQKITTPWGLEPDWGAGWDSGRGHQIACCDPSLRNGHHSGSSPTPSPGAYGPCYLKSVVIPHSIMCHSSLRTLYWGILPLFPAFHRYLSKTKGMWILTQKYFIHMPSNFPNEGGETSSLCGNSESKDCMSLRSRIYFVKF